MANIVGAHESMPRVVIGMGPLRRLLTPNIYKYAFSPLPVKVEDTVCLLGIPESRRRRAHTPGLVEERAFGG